SWPAAIVDQDGDRAHGQRLRARTGGEADGEPKRAVAVAQEHADAVGVVVGCGYIELAVPVEVSDLDVEIPDIRHAQEQVRGTVTGCELVGVRRGKGAITMA